MFYIASLYFPSYKKHRHGSYIKDDLLEPGGDNAVFRSSQPKDVSFDNPLYDSRPGEIQIGQEIKEELHKPEDRSSSPVLVVGEEDLSPVVAMDKYERL